ncbi:MAG: cell division protein FtsL [Pseudomonadales bacterium]|jgi:cell division protein FtsL
MLFRLLGVVLALLGVVASGVQVAYSSQAVRTLRGELQAAQRHQDAELAEYSRLLLERSMETSYANVERVAQIQLGMIFPERAEQVER